MLVVLNVLSLARDEVQWMLRHHDNPPQARRGNVKVNFEDFVDRCRPGLTLECARSQRNPLTPHQHLAAAERVPPTNSAVRGKETDSYNVLFLELIELQSPIFVQLCRSKGRCYLL